MDLAYEDSFKRHVPIERYTQVASTYEMYPEYVDGVIEERNGGCQTTPPGRWP
jgi:hypothetical protein